MLSRRDREVLPVGSVLRRPLALGQRLLGRASEALKTEGNEHRVDI